MTVLSGALVMGLELSLYGSQSRPTDLNNIQGI